MGINIEQAFGNDEEVFVCLGGRDRGIFVRKSDLGKLADVAAQAAQDYEVESGGLPAEPKGERHDPQDSASTSELEEWNADGYPGNNVPPARCAPLAPHEYRTYDYNDSAPGRTLAHLYDNASTGEVEVHEMDEGGKSVRAILSIGVNGVTLFQRGAPDGTKRDTNGSVDFISVQREGLDD